MFSSEDISTINSTDKLWERLDPWPLLNVGSFSYLFVVMV